MKILATLILLITSSALAIQKVGTVPMKAHLVATETYHFHSMTSADLKQDLPVDLWLQDDGVRIYGSAYMKFLYGDKRTYKQAVEINGMKGDKRLNVKVSFLRQADPGNDSVWEEIEYGDFKLNKDGSIPEITFHEKTSDEILPDHTLDIDFSVSE